MPDAHARQLVVEHAAARDAGLLERAGVTVVPSARRRRERVDADDVLDALDAAGPEALVLTRPPWSEPTLAPLAALSVVTGREMLWLPPDLGRAAWAVALIAAWARTTPADDLLRRAQVAAGLATLPPGHLPMRAWGPDDAPVPAMTSDSLARWCDCAWQECQWCDGGGVGHAPCPSCGHRGVPA